MEALRLGLDLLIPLNQFFLSVGGIPCFLSYYDAVKCGRCSARVTKSFFLTIQCVWQLKTLQINPRFKLNLRTMYAIYFITHISTRKFRGKSTSHINEEITQITPSKSWEGVTDDGVSAGFLRTPELSQKTLDGGKSTDCMKFAQEVKAANFW